jgi:hypothetical protein
VHADPRHIEQRFDVGKGLDSTCGGEAEGGGPIAGQREIGVLPAGGEDLDGQN